LLIACVQNSLFDEQYASDLRNFPQDATAHALSLYDKLADESLAVNAQRNETDRTFLSRLQAIPTTGRLLRPGVLYGVRKRVFVPEYGRTKSRGELQRR
jgi:hypothetical protein